MDYDIEQSELGSSPYFIINQSCESVTDTSSMW